MLDCTANSITIADASGSIADAIWDSVESIKLASFYVLNFNDSSVTGAPDQHTFGTWSAAPSFASGETTFTDAQADDGGPGFASWLVGCYLIADVDKWSPLLITATTATTLKVKGDATSRSANALEYQVFVPAQIDETTGTLDVDVLTAGTDYLWAGYRYMPPQMGVYVDPAGAPALGTYGAQTGTNKLGQYHAWNRVYDVSTGRWTTPDPVATPWWNLFDYVGQNAVLSTDPSGLGQDKGLNDIIRDCDLEGLAKYLAQIKKKIKEMSDGWKRIETSKYDGSIQGPTCSDGIDDPKEEEKYNGHRTSLSELCSEIANVKNAIKAGDLLGGCVGADKQGKMSDALNELSEAFDGNHADGGAVCPQDHSAVGDFYTAAEGRQARGDAPLVSDPHVGRMRQGPGRSSSAPSTGNGTSPTPIMPPVPRPATGGITAKDIVDGFGAVGGRIVKLAGLPFVIILPPDAMLPTVPKPGEIQDTGGGQVG